MFCPPVLIIIVNSNEKLITYVHEGCRFYTSVQNCN